MAYSHNLLYLCTCFLIMAVGIGAVLQNFLLVNSLRSMIPETRCRLYHIGYSALLLIGSSFSLSIITSFFRNSDFDTFTNAIRLCEGVANILFSIGIMYAAKTVIEIFYLQQFYLVLIIFNLIELATYLSVLIVLANFAIIHIDFLFNNFGIYYLGSIENFIQNLSVYSMIMLANLLVTSNIYTSRSVKKGHTEAPISRILAWSLVAFMAVPMLQRLFAQPAASSFWAVMVDIFTIITGTALLYVWLMTISRMDKRKTYRLYMNKHILLLIGIMIHTVLVISATSIFAVNNIKTDYPAEWFIFSLILCYSAWKTAQNFKTIITEHVDQTIENGKNKTPGLFLAQVAHEIYNPIRPVRTFLSDEGLQRLLHAPQTDQQLDQERLSLLEFHPFVVDGVARIMAYTETLKEKSNLVEQKQSFELVHETIQFIESYKSIIASPSNSGKSIALHFRTEIETANLAYDKRDWSSVLQILLDNAVAATDPERLNVIQVAMRRVGKQIICSVTDSGTGMTAEQASLYSKKQFSTKRATGEGMGMGSLIARKLVENKLGGELRLINSVLNRGTQIEITLRV
ncbi:MAG: sensor histidine kinase [Magnetococcales bacterium]|nr:sensor histidine kinase [Magnetococcales bacterium]MBF0113901.1 sensor histidine kinase [Magnetococcales bacterium]